MSPQSGPGSVVSVVIGSVVSVGSAVVVVSPLVVSVVTGPDEVGPALVVVVVASPDDDEDSLSSESSPPLPSTGSGKQPSVSAARATSAVRVSERGGGPSAVRMFKCSSD